MSLKVRGLPPPQDHGHTESGDGGQLGEMVGIPEVGPMPNPCEELLGRTVRWRHGGKTELRVCVINSEGGCEWLEIGEST